MRQQLARRGRRTRLALSLICSTLLGLALLLPAVPAAAHAALVGTTPENGLVLKASPGEIVLRYSEPVRVSLGSVKVLDPDGERVDDGTVSSRAEGREVVVPVPS